MADFIHPLLYACSIPSLGLFSRLWSSVGFTWLLYATFRMEQVWRMQKREGGKGKKLPCMQMNTLNTTTRPFLHFSHLADALIQSDLQ